MYVCMYVCWYHRLTTNVGFVYTNPTAFEPAFFSHSTLPSNSCLQRVKRKYLPDSFSEVSSKHRICQPQQDLFQPVPSVPNIFGGIVLVTVYSSSSFCLSFIELQILHSVWYFLKLYIPPAHITMFFARVKTVV